MNMDYLDIANSPAMLILSGLVILVVVVQAIIFIRSAVKRGKELGMEDDLKPVVTNSILLSIVPSLPIIVIMLALSVPLGRYFPWLRLSIVGGAAYEGVAANVGAQSIGLTDISDPNMTPDAFVIIMFVMTVGIIWGIVFNILFIKQLDKAAITARNRARATDSGGFVSILSGALLVGMLAVISTPYVLNTDNLEGIIAFVTAGITVLICNKLAKIFDKKLLSDFAFTIGLLVGMGAVIIYANAV